jgi:hypothetical protein
MQYFRNDFVRLGGNRLAEMLTSKKLLEPVHYTVNIIKLLKIRPSQHCQWPKVKISTQLDVFSRSVIVIMLSATITWSPRTLI